MNSYIKVGSSESDKTNFVEDESEKTETQIANADFTSCTVPTPITEILANLRTGRFSFALIYDNKFILSIFI